jgi:parvulin-like peptidyl-prolyl isomerase
MRAWKGFAAALALAGAAATMSWPVEAAKEDDVVARLDGNEVKASDLKAALEAIDPALRRQAEQNPQLMAQLVRAAVGRMAVLAEAHKQSWDSRPQVVNQVEQAKRDVVIASFLQSVSVPPDGYPGEKEIAAAYDANRDRLMMPRQYHLAQIFVAVPAGADAAAAKAAEAKARELDRKARDKKTDFGALAAASSDDKASAARKGDFGWVPESQIVPEIRSVVQGLTDNEVSEPIRTTAGWHVVQMLGTKPAAPRPLEEVRQSLIASLRQQKVTQNEQAYVSDLLARQHVAINEIAADKLIQSMK